MIGNFYPPHRGHKHLIDTAGSQVVELHVIVCQRPGEKPEGSLRAAWLREIHPSARVLLIDDVLHRPRRDEALPTRMFVDGPTEVDCASSEIGCNVVAKSWVRLTGRNSYVARPNELLGAEE